jgi:hypothetical protein
MYIGDGYLYSERLQQSSGVDIRRAIAGKGNMN